MQTLATPFGSRVSVFTFESSAKVRVVSRDAAPWFVAADLLATLNLDRKALERLDADEKGVNPIHTPGGLQEMTVVNESGLYSLILGSRKPEARKFKKWITAEVLPAIRRTGQYVTQLDGDEDLDATPMTPGEVAEIERLKRVICHHFKFKHQASYGLRKVLDFNFGSQPYRRWQYPLIHALLMNIAEKAAQYCDHQRSLDRLFWEGAREMSQMSRVAVDSKLGKVWDHRT